MSQIKRSGDSALNDVENQSKRIKFDVGTQKDDRVNIVCDEVETEPVNLRVHVLKTTWANKVMKQHWFFKAGHRRA